MKHYNFCSDKSFVKDGVLHEYFSITHYNEYKPVNRAEQAIIEYAIKLLEQPRTDGIEAIRDIITSQVMPKGYGSFIVHPVRRAGSIVGKPNWCERQFTISAGKRSIPTLIISETVMKDSDNNYQFVNPDDLVFNKHLKTNVPL